MIEDNTQLNTMFDRALGNTKGRTTPTRRRNKAYRAREYLTPDEMALLIEGAKPGRDRTLITTAYVHGLRLAEIVALRWEQVDLEAGLLHVIRVKRGTPAIHPIPAGESKMLHSLYKDPARREFVFRSRQNAQISRSSVQGIIRKAGKNAKSIRNNDENVTLRYVHAHSLRHACGYRLAAAGVDTRAIQAYLGHRSIQCTVKYTDLAPNRFDGIWPE